MCWAVPAKVVEVRDDIAVVDFGNGMLKEVLIATDERIEAGDLVLVHAGTVISKVDEEWLALTVEIYEELAKSLPEGGFDARREVEEALKKLSLHDER